MSAKLLVVLALATVAAALPAQLPAARGNYKFLYAVHDDRSGDFKQQRETRHGNSVQGSYSLLQPDGRTRVVHYTADKEHGFVASVRYEGHVAPPPAKLVSAPKVAFAPQAKTAYAIPRVTNVTHKVSYSAPKFAFTAPKVTYTENFGHVSYSSPIMAYHH